MGFLGYYIKCQGKKESIAVIVGRSDDKDFVQVITDDETFYADNTKDNFFDEHGMRLDIRQDGLSILGEIKFGTFTQIKGDIMGPFRWLPFMECRHTITSMRHKISGQIKINNKTYNFDDGVGYIEGDRGKSFPTKYFWTQAHLDGGIDVSASVAIIPYLGVRFTGSICVIIIDGQEHRLATYKGAKVKRFEQGGIEIKQGKLCLVVDVLDNRPALPLLAPNKGIMTRVIHECIRRSLRYRLFWGEDLLFDKTTDRGSYEFSDNSLNKII